MLEIGNEVVVVKGVNEGKVGEVVRVSKNSNRRIDSCKIKFEFYSKDYIFYEKGLIEKIIPLDIFENLKEYYLEEYEEIFDLGRYEKQGELKTSTLKNKADSFVEKVGVSLEKRLKKELNSETIYNICNTVYTNVMKEQRFKEGYPDYLDPGEYLHI